MELTREKALKLHRKMWRDMQDTLGDTPNPAERIYFKENWISAHFSNAEILNSCFLCQYVNNNSLGCRSCPIKWPNGYCGTYYIDASISKILALPEGEN